MASIPVEETIGEIPEVPIEMGLVVPIVVTIVIIVVTIVPIVMRLMVPIVVPIVATMVPIVATIVPIVMSAPTPGRWKVKEQRNAEKEGQRY